MMVAVIIKRKSNCSDFGLPLTERTGDFQGTDTGRLSVYQVSDTVTFVSQKEGGISITYNGVFKSFDWSGRNRATKNSCQPLRKSRFQGPFALGG